MTPDWTAMRRWLSSAWLDLLIAALVAAAEAAMLVPWLHLLAGLAEQPSSSVPSGVGLFLVGLVTLLAGRFLLGGGWDIGAARAISLAIWLALMVGWLAVAEGRTLTAPWAFIDQLVSLDGALLARLGLGWLAWWRGMVLAADPDPFTPEFGRRLVGRAVLVAGAALLLATVAGGQTADQVTGAAAGAVPLLLIAGLLAAGAMQVRAARRRLGSTGARRAGSGWLGAAAGLTLGIVLLAVLAAGLAGRGFWDQVFGPLGSILFPLQVGVFWLLAGIAFAIYLVLSPIFWALRQLAGGDVEQLPQPARPSPGELQQFGESTERVLPGFVVSALEVGGIVVLIGLAVWLALRSLRRYRAAPQNRPVEEIHERLSSGGPAFGQLAAAVRGLLPRRPERRGGALDLDAEPADVRAAYRYLLALGAREGQARHAAESPLDYADRLGHAWAEVDAPVADLTERYLVARYADQTSAEDTDRARAAWHTIRRWFATPGR